MELDTQYHLEVKDMISFQVSLSKKSFQCFFGYKGGKKVRHTFISLPKVSAYRGDFDGTKYMSFLIKDNDLLEKNLMKFRKTSAIASRKDI